jgi:hypothetical protein
VTASAASYPQKDEAMLCTDETIYDINERQRALGSELKRRLPVYSSLPLDMEWLLDRLDRQGRPLVERMSGDRGAWFSPDRTKLAQSQSSRL